MVADRYGSKYGAQGQLGRVVGWESKELGRKAAGGKGEERTESSLELDEPVLLGLRGSSSEGLVDDAQQLK